MIILNGRGYIMKQGMSRGANSTNHESFYKYTILYNNIIVICNQQYPFKQCKIICVSYESVIIQNNQNCHLRT